MKWVCVGLLFCTGCVSLTFRGSVVDTTVHLDYNWEENEFRIRPEINYNEKFKKEFDIAEKPAKLDGNILAVY